MLLKSKQQKKTELDSMSPSASRVMTESLQMSTIRSHNPTQLQRNHLTQLLTFEPGKTLYQSQRDDRATVIKRGNLPANQRIKELLSPYKAMKQSIQSQCFDLTSSVELQRGFHPHERNL